MGIRSAKRGKVNVLEMTCLRSLVGESLMDRVRNEEVRRRAGIERELASRADQRVLSWFGHVERMDEYRMARRVLMSHGGSMWKAGTRETEVRLDGWCEGGLGNRGMMMEAARQCSKDLKEWIALVHM